MNRKLNDEIKTWLARISAALMSNVLYVLSNPESEGRYKVGIHRGTLNLLKSRYSTYIPDVKVHYFFENVDARAVETAFLKNHEKDRVTKKHSGNASEWVKLPLDVILMELLLLIVGQRVGLRGKKKFRVNGFDGSKVGKTRILVFKRTNSEEDESTSSEEDSGEDSEQTSSEQEDD